MQDTGRGQGGPESSTSDSAVLHLQLPARNSHEPSVRDQHWRSTGCWMGQALSISVSSTPPGTRIRRRWGKARRRAWNGLVRLLPPCFSPQSTQRSCCTPLKGPQAHSYCTHPASDPVQSFPCSLCMHQPALLDSKSPQTGKDSHQGLLQHLLPAMAVERGAALAPHSGKQTPGRQNPTAPGQLPPRS